MFIFHKRLPENDIDAMEALIKENHLLKQQLQNCFSKVAKTQKVNESFYILYVLIITIHKIRL